MKLKSKGELSVPAIDVRLNVFFPELEKATSMSTFSPIGKRGLAKSGKTADTFTSACGPIFFGVSSSPSNWLA
jgi:hypothetical protein